MSQFSWAVKCKLSKHVVVSENLVGISLPAQTLSRTAVVWWQEFLEVLSFRLHL